MNAIEESSSVPPRHPNRAERNKAKRERWAQQAAQENILPTSTERASAWLHFQQERERRSDKIREARRASYPLPIDQLKDTWFEDGTEKGIYSGQLADDDAPSSLHPAFVAWLIQHLWQEVEAEAPTNPVEQVWARLKGDALEGKRTAIVLIRRLDGMMVQTIAKELGVHERTVYRHLEKGWPVVRRLYAKWRHEQGVPDEEDGEDSGETP